MFLCTTFELPVMTTTRSIQSRLTNILICELFTRLFPQSKYTIKIHPEKLAGKAIYFLFEIKTKGLVFLRKLFGDKLSNAFGK